MITPRRLRRPEPKRELNVVSPPIKSRPGHVTLLKQKSTRQWWRQFRSSRAA